MWSNSSSPKRSPAPRNPEAGFGALIEESLTALRIGQPRAWVGLCAALDGRVLALTVDGETWRVGGPGEAVAVRQGAGAAVARLTTTGACLLDLVDGRSTLLDALLSERMLLVGPVDECLRFFDAWRIYLLGAVRSDACAVLLARYRATVVAGQGGDRWLTEKWRSLGAASRV